MPRTVHIAGPADGFQAAMLDRLVRAGASFCDNPEDANVSLGIGQGSSGNIVVIPSDSTPGSAELVVRIHDLIVPSGKREWGTGLLLDWVAGVKSGRIEGLTIDPITRYWVHVNDVVDALSTLIMTDGGPVAKGEIYVCGRRAWHSQDVIEEIVVLWQRYLNSVHHSHTVESLSEVPSPVKQSTSNQTKRPDLGPLHDALIDSGGEGWHPLVPMRTALMELIAVSD